MKNLPAECVCGDAALIVGSYGSDINIKKDRDVFIDASIVFVHNSSLL
ncbi:hypothetical protein CPter91_0348 [Collimonas pratensis]|uniref:Uncharacterized protein n=1 Tax=Collimonas pratensis TaxID=279113 RepID=A0A127PY85_9BURK|nr:hypothetical protein CPter91_0348 [Collimonas pratensis]